MMYATVEQWGVFELELRGLSSGNPFTEVAFGARFKHQHREMDIDGFYDGEGIYRVRFMPDTQGEWEYQTHSNQQALDGQSGVFTCMAPAKHNHGPVRVHNTYHFAYADGTPHVSIGTTCYAWAHQGDELEEQTLHTLKRSLFNKICMCLFPKHYPFNYLRYLIARLASYRHVWWSMANEFDLMRAKSEIDWDRFFRIIQERDPYICVPSTTVEVSTTMVNLG